MREPLHAGRAGGGIAFRRWKRRPVKPEGVAVPQSQRGWRNSVSLFDDPERRLRLIEILFFVLLAVIMIRITMGDADSEEARLARSAALESGDAVKQLIYISLFGIISVVWVSLKGWVLPKSLSWFQIGLLLWVFLSVSWAIDPHVAFRRSVLLFVVVFSIAYCVDMVGPEKAYRILYWLLGLCMVLSLLSVVFFSFAVHPATEVDKSLIGAWRGIFVHKNTAGGLAAGAIIIFLHNALNRKDLASLIFLVSSIIFLIGTKSKTPMGLMPVALLMSFMYRYFYATSLRRHIFAVLSVVALTACFVLVLVYKAQIMQVLENPLSFTGRAGIWQAALDYWKDHPFLGAGYSSLWGITGEGGKPPILPYINSPEQEYMVHSHSGYIELLSTIGIPGFFLAVMAAVVYPLFQIFSMKEENLEENSIIFGIFIFSILENFLETQLYTRDREIWVVFFISLLVLHLRYKRRERPVYRRLSAPKPVMVSAEG